MRTALQFACVLAVLAAAVGPALASPQPTPTCRFCGAAFERAAADGGADVTVAGSTADVRIHENGSATWTVRNELTDAAALNGSLDATARSLAERGHGPPDDPVLVDARREGDAVVLVYRDPDAAERRVGLLVADYYHDDGARPWYRVNADRLTIHGPDGTAVTNDPDGVAIDGGTATWRGNGSAALYEAPDVRGSPFVVFGPDRSAATGIRTTAAVALATAPVVSESARSFLLWQTVAFTVVLVGVVALLRRRRLPVDAASTGVALVGLGALAAAVPVAVHGVEWLFGAPIFVAALGALVAADVEALRDRLATPRGQAAVAAGLLAAAYLATALLGAAAGAWDEPLAAALRSTAFALPLAASLPLGAVVDGDADRLLPWGALAVLAFAAVPPLAVDFANPPAGLGSGLAVIFLLVAAVVVPLVGVPVVSLGRSLADRTAD